MVSTRSHPSTFSPPDASPSKALTRSSGGDVSSQRKPGSWSHTPDAITLVWLFVSLPLVIWDFIYVFGRPHTMPGGWFHKPVYSPYALYGIVDHVYGWESWNEHDGFTAAQSALNVAETAGYLAYLWMLYTYGKGSKFGQRTLSGGWGGFACLCGFALAVMTVSKTVLYGLNETFSGFKHIGHNDLATILFLWVLPNGAWIIVPSYLVYVFGRDILQGLAIASVDTTSKPARIANALKDD